MSPKQLIELANQLLAQQFTDTGTIPRHLVKANLFAQLRTGALALLFERFGESHPFYKEFDSKVKQPLVRDVEMALGILKAVETNLTNSQP